VDAILELCDEGVEVYKDPAVVEMVSALTPRGHERVETYLRGWLDSWDMYQPTVVALHEVGDDVVALLDVHARGRSSQFDIEEEIADVLTFRGNKIARLRLHVTREVALRDSGLGD
jgi:ketosteroid isomerase-like protein